MADGTAPEALQEDDLDAVTGGHRTSSHRRIQPVSLMKRVDQTSPGTSVDHASFQSSASGNLNV